MKTSYNERKQLNFQLNFSSMIQLSTVVDIHLHLDSCYNHIIGSIVKIDVPKNRPSSPKLQ